VPCALARAGDVPRSRPPILNGGGRNCSPHRTARRQGRRAKRNADNTANLCVSTRTGSSAALHMQRRAPRFLYASRAPSHAATADGRMFCAVSGSEDTGRAPVT